MRITKFGHACVRIQGDGGVVVIDPGSFTDPAALEGADAVLITHEHADHVHPAHLRGTEMPIWTIAAVERMLRDQAPDVAERVTVVRPGDRLEVAGTAVEVVGEKHAVIHPDYDRFDNSGYVLESGGASIYHPGDALLAPGRSVDVLLAPVSAPWLKVGEAIDFVREVGAPRSLAIHDCVYSEVALGMVEAHMTNLALTDAMSYTRLADGADLDW